MWRTSLTILMLLLAVSTLLPTAPLFAAPLAQPANLLVNGGFEQGAFNPNGAPTGWAKEAFSSSALFTWDNTVAHSGQRSVKINLATVNDARWVQLVNLQPNTDYEFSGWVKTQGIPFMNQVVDAGANLSTSGAFLLPTSHGVYGTTDWTYVSLNFNSGSYTSLTLYARIGYFAGGTVGTAWFDDLKLVQLTRTVDAHSMLWNGDFEQASYPAPYAIPYGWWTDRQGQQYLTWDAANAYFGTHSVKIDCPNYCASLYQQAVAVDPNTSYLLSGWIKTEDVSHTNGVVDVGANLNLGGLWVMTPPLFGTNDWTYVSQVFNVGNRTVAYVHARMGYDSGGSRGRAWYDGVQLRPLGANMIVNPDFALGDRPWTFFTNGQGTYTVVAKDGSADVAAKIELTKKGANTRFFQQNLYLEPNTRYRLQFTAYSNTARDLLINLEQPVTVASYGLRNYRPNLTKGWKSYVVDFTTKGFTQPVFDGRLRFVFETLARAGDIYWIDNISLKKQSGVTAAEAEVLAGGLVAGNVLGASEGVTLTVTDLETGGALYQATVTTDAAGQFSLTGLPAGTFTLTVHAPQGYLAPDPVVFVSADELTDLELLVEPVTTTLYLPQVFR